MKQFILFLLFSTSFFLFGQNPNYSIIDKTNGLPSNSVYDIFQDSKGFIWFSTAKGICRFDGATIKTFSNKLQTSKSGSGILEDKYGRIWYENFDGYLYYIENDELKLLKNAESISYFRFGIINNTLFVLQQNSINLYDLKSLQLKKRIAINEYYKFSVSNDTHFYVLGKKLYEIDEKGNKKSYKLPKIFENDFPFNFLQKYKKGILISSKFNKNYLIFENGTFTHKKIDYSIDFFQNISTYHDELWVCTPKGTLKISSNDKPIHFFKNENISNVFRDKQQNYWFATLNKGVFFVENFDTKFIAFDKIPNTITKTNSEIIIGTDKAELYTFDVLENSFSAIYKGQSNHAVNQLMYDEISKKIYFTSSKFGVISNNKLILEIVNAVKDINRVDEKYITYAATNNSGLIMTNPNLKSDWDALFKSEIDTSDTKFNNAFLIRGKNGKSSVFNPVNNTIYYATNKGLIAQKTNSQEEITYNNSTCYFSKLNFFDGKVYALSTNEKIFIIDTQNNISLFKLPFGYENEIVEFIKIQEQFLYAFIADEILEFDLKNNTHKKIISIRKDITISDITLFKNNIYIASSKGILIKNRTLLQKNSNPKLIINKTLVNDTFLDVSEAKTLNYDENNIKIDFSILSFLPNEKNTVFYKINNSNWYQLESNSRNVNLISLAPGTYAVTLKLNEKGNFETINFTIKNPFWKTPLFIILLILITLSSLYFLYTRKLQQIDKKNQLKLDKINLEKNLNQSKLKAIKSQMNPHFFYNALNTLQSYILSNEKKEAVEYLSKFSNLTRTILEATEKDFVTIHDEIKTLKLYLEIEKARFEKDFMFEIIVEKNIEIDTIKIPTLLIQPYVENAVKHGLLHKQGLKKLEIHFEKIENSLKISIDDNGIGRKKSSELNSIKNKNHISFATKAMQNRIELLNQFTNTTSTISIIDKTNQQGKPTGTKVVLSIYINY
ncbi:sensor histidine kinase [Polaribacter gangjinensis]|uniref:sensor histidine kinase n=1 Tax=Polaribacter gangjinensis TaxID=574710 RepID=UPI000CF48469|nr:histidine kinase [Polaribacter gangjinensis]